MNNEQSPLAQRTPPKSLLTQSSPPLNIVVVGQGAIGLLYYSFLKAAPTIQVSLLSSKNVNRNIASLTVKSKHALKDSRYSIKHASTETLENADVILLCVKAYQAEQALCDIENHLSLNTSVILCHNGMGVFDALPDAFKEKHTFFTMLTTHGCKKVSNKSQLLTDNGYVIEHTGVGETSLGPLSHKKTLSQAQPILSNCFKKMLSPFTWLDDIEKQQWTKLAINCVINPLTAIHRIQNGEILAERYRNTVNEILNEIVTIAQYEHVTLSKEQLLNAVLSVAKNTAINSSSMLCDVTENRPSEVDYINGFIHFLGAKHNIETPVNSALWREVKAMPTA